MSDEEIAVLYYLSNLVLLSRFTLVKTICEKNLLLMSKVSTMFKANVLRYLVLSFYRLEMMKEEINPCSLSL